MSSLATTAEVLALAAILLVPQASTLTCLSSPRAAGGRVACQEGQACLTLITDFRPSAGYNYVDDFPCDQTSQICLEYAWKRFESLGSVGRFSSFQTVNFNYFSPLNTCMWKTQFNYQNVRLQTKRKNSSQIMASHCPKK